MDQLVVEDLSYGLNEWRNIQTVVRETFKVFYDVMKYNSEAIKSQAAAIQRLEKALDSKVNKTEFQGAIATKASSTEITNLNRRITDLNRVIDEKADRGEIMVDLNKKANATEVASRIAEVLSLAEDSADEWKKDLKTNVADIRLTLEEKFGEMQTSFQNALNEKVDSEDVQQVLSQISAHVTALKEDSSAKPSKGNIEEDILKRVEETHKIMEEGLKSRASKKSTIAALGKKANREDIEMLQREKASVSDLEALKEELEMIKQLKGVGSPMKEPTSLKQLERAHTELKATMNEFLGLLANKVSRNELEEVVGRPIRSKLGSTNEIEPDVRKDLSLKANIKDVITLLDTKAGVDDVNTALMEVNKELELRPTISQLDQFIAPREWIGRWLWKSGKTKSGHGVPWNIQLLNSNPQNFLWEKDKMNIVIVSPGLYEISYGFFSKTKPPTSVQLLLNGHTVSGLQNAKQSHKLENAPHPSGNITGLSLLDFIALPPKARVALSYNGDAEVEAFLNLRKL